MKLMMLIYKNQNLVSYGAFHDVAVACLNPSHFFSPCGSSQPLEPGGIFPRLVSESQHCCSVRLAASLCSTPTSP